MTFVTVSLLLLLRAGERSVSPLQVQVHTGGCIGHQDGCIVPTLRLPILLFVRANAVICFLLRTSLLSAVVIVSIDQRALLQERY